MIAIFCKQYLNKQPLTVVLPGTQSRRFTHVKDIISGGGAVMQNDVLYLTGYNSKSQIILYFFNLRGQRGGLSRKYKRFMRGRKNTRGSRMRE